MAVITVGGRVNALAVRRDSTELRELVDKFELAEKQCPSYSGQ